MFRFFGFWLHCGKKNVRLKKKEIIFLIKLTNSFNSQRAVAHAKLKVFELINKWVEFWLTH